MSIYDALYVSCSVIVLLVAYVGWHNSEDLPECPSDQTGPLVLKSRAMFSKPNITDSWFFGRVFETHVYNPLHIFWKVWALSQLKYNSHSCKVPIIDVRDQTSFHKHGVQLFRLNLTDHELVQTENYLLLKQLVGTLYPDAIEFRIGSSIVRGGNDSSNKPLQNPHLDFYPDLIEYEKKNFPGERFFDFPFLKHEDKPRVAEIVKSRTFLNKVYGRFFPGQMNHELSDILHKEDQLRRESDLKFVLLGIWRPSNMSTPVCDYPLSFLLSNTTAKKDIVPLNIRLVQDIGPQRIPFLAKITGGRVKHKASHLWGFYPNMTNEEVVIWHHFSSDGSLFNPHFSAYEKNCPPGSESRRSNEARMLVVLKSV